MRMDLIWAGLYSTEYPSYAQLYPTCAQIRVVSEYSGSLPKGILIPEDLADDLPGTRKCYLLKILAVIILIIQPRNVN